MVCFLYSYKHAFGTGYCWRWDTKIDGPVLTNIWCLLFEKLWIRLPCLCWQNLAVRIFCHWLSVNTYCSLNSKNSWVWNGFPHPQKVFRFQKLFQFRSGTTLRQFFFLPWKDGGVGRLICPSKKSSIIRAYVWDVRGRQIEVLICLRQDVNCCLPECKQRLPAFGDNCLQWEYLSAFNQKFHPWPGKAAL